MSDEDENEKDDFTSIENLGEYIHELDSEAEKVLEDGSKDSESSHGHDSSEDSSSGNDSFLSNDSDQDDGDSFETSSAEDSTSEYESNDQFSSSEDESSEDELSTSDFSTENNEDMNFNSSEDDAHFDGDFSSSNDEDDDQSNNSDNNDFFSQDDSSDFSSSDEEDRPEFSSSEESEDELVDFNASSDESISDETQDSFDEPPPIDDTQDDFLEDEEKETTTSISEPPPVPPSSSSTPPQPSQSTPSQYSPENLNEVREFGENIKFGNLSTPGSPPYSIILRNIIYQEDKDDIKRMLREFKLLDDQNQNVIESALSHGALLIPQLSEFSAIFLCHKFRHLDIDIQMGLSEEIHPPKSTSNARGLISKEALFQNIKDEKNLKHQKIDLKAIQLSTSPQLEGRQIVRYLAIATEHALIDEDYISRNDFNIYETPMSSILKNDPDNKPSKSHQRSILESIEDIDRLIASFEDESHHKDLGIKGSIKENVSPSLIEVYSSLANKLKYQAIKEQGNAIVGINYQLTPVLGPGSSNYKALYKITCTGNIVWAN